MKETLQIRDIMSRDAYYVTQQTSINDLIQGLSRHKLSGAPVADKYGNLIGFVSEQDVLPQLLQNAYYCNQPNSIESVMQTDVLTVKPSDTVMTLAKMMLDRKPKVYPVVEDRRIIGIVTRHQIAVALIESQKNCVPV
ncbi:CBS domain-containing protein [Marinomonas sp. PE14-40]|uniref:CBS domain-containing protein n=1 Tax=Marinomonas sp. PE14-40 TaxID=3060621 RepID=UPI003F662B16